MQGPIYSSAEFMQKKNSNLFGDCYFYTHKKISNKYMQMFYMGKIHFSG